MLKNMFFLDLMIDDWCSLMFIDVLTDVLTDVLIDVLIDVN